MHIVIEPRLIERSYSATLRSQPRTEVPAPFVTLEKLWNLAFVSRNSPGVEISPGVVIGPPCL
jgi:hypothetical protein